MNKPASPSRFFCRALLTLLACALLAPVLQAQSGAVIPTKKRKAILEQGRTFIYQQDPELKATFAELRYPFAFKVEKVEEVVETVVEAPKEPELTDKDVLAEVAPKINATGTMMRGGTSYLIFSNGQLPEGGSIKLNFRGKPYIVRVANITSAGYELRLNDEVYKKTFGHESSGTIERDTGNSN